MKVLTKILIVLAVLVVLLGIAAGVLYFLATTDDNAGKYEAEPSTDIVEPAVKAALTGQETEITQDQINGFFSYYIQENGLTLAGHRVKKLYLQLGETPGAVSLYLVCEGLGKGFGNYRPGTDDLLRGRQGVFSANQRYEGRQAEGAGLLGPVLDFVQAAGGNGGSGRHGCHRLAAFADSVR